MTMTQTFSTALSCTITDVLFSSQDGSPLTQLQVGVPVNLSTTITFSDQALGELATLLMADNLSLRITFHAKPTTPDRTLELGSVTLQTVANVLTYTAMLTLEDLAASPLSVDTSYQLGAIVRVGTDLFSMPSLMRGFVEGAMIEGTSQPASSGASIEDHAALAIATTPKTSRRKETQREKQTKERNVG